MKRDKKYFDDIIIPSISTECIVMSGDSAMCRTGRSISNVWVPTVLVDDINLSGFNLHGTVRYFYIPRVDYEHWVVPYKGNPMTLLSSFERSVIEGCKYGTDLIIADYFCDTLERYQNNDDTFNYQLLKDIAEFFECPMSNVDYWLEESADYNSY